MMHSLIGCKSMWTIPTLISKYLQRAWDTLGHISPLHFMIFNIVLYTPPHGVWYLTLAVRILFVRLSVRTKICVYCLPRQKGGRTEFGRPMKKHSTCNPLCQQQKISKYIAPFPLLLEHPSVRSPHIRLYFVSFWWRWCL